jgi:hypothetical protein
MSLEALQKKNQNYKAIIFLGREIPQQFARSIK